MRESASKKAKLSLGVSVSSGPLMEKKYLVTFFLLKLTSSGFSTKYSFPALTYFIAKDKHLPIESVLLRHVVGEAGAWAWHQNTMPTTCIGNPLSLLNTNLLSCEAG